MPVKLLYFAWVRERIGKTEEIALPARVATVADLVVWLKGRGPGYAEALRARRRDPRGDRPGARRAARRLAGAREIAFFPPMTGG